MYILVQTPLWALGKEDRVCLRWLKTCTSEGFSSEYKLSASSNNDCYPFSKFNILPLIFSDSKILLSKQKIIDLFPKIEKTLENIKEADSTVMQMQMKRQREFWHLLKIACVSIALFKLD